MCLDCGPILGIYKSPIDSWMSGNGTEVARFLFWEHINEIFGAVWLPTFHLSKRFFLVMTGRCFDYISQLLGVKGGSSSNDSKIVCSSLLIIVPSSKQGTDLYFWEQILLKQKAHRWYMITILFCLKGGIPQHGCLGQEDQPQKSNHQVRCQLIINSFILILYLHHMTRWKNSFV